MSTPEDVDTYIANAAAEAKPILAELRRIIQSTIPEVEEKISWGVPFYRFHGEIGGFDAFKHHVNFGFGQGVLEDKDRAMLEQKGYKVLKGTMHIRFDQKVPAAAIKKILKAKVKINRAKMP